MTSDCGVGHAKDWKEQRAAKQWHCVYCRREMLAVALMILRLEKLSTLMLPTLLLCTLVPSKARLKGGVKDSGLVYRPIIPFPLYARGGLIEAASVSCGSFRCHPYHFGQRCTIPPPSLPFSIPLAPLEPLTSPISVHNASVSLDNHAL